MSNFAQLREKIDNLLIIDKYQVSRTHHYSHQIDHLEKELMEIREELERLEIIPKIKKTKETKNIQSQKYVEIIKQIHKQMTKIKEIEKSKEVKHGFQKTFDLGDLLSDLLHDNNAPSEYTIEIPSGLEIKWNTCVVIPENITLKIVSNLPRPTIKMTNDNFIGITKVFIPLSSNLIFWNIDFDVSLKNDQYCEETDDCAIFYLDGAVGTGLSTIRISDSTITTDTSIAYASKHSFSQIICHNIELKCQNYYHGSPIRTLIKDDSHFNSEGTVFFSSCDMNLNKNCRL